MIHPRNPLFLPRPFVGGLLVLVLAACGNEPSPVLIGSISSGAQHGGRSGRGYGDLDVEINGQERRIDLDDTQAFAVQDLPYGELTFRVAIEGITGTLEVDDVLPGEVIEVDVEAGPGRLELGVVRRDAPAFDDPDDPPVFEDRDGIEIHGRHIVHHLPHGRIRGDIRIHGEHVTLVGPDLYRCRSGGRAILEGDLIVHGRHVRVVNLEVEGRVSVHGEHVKIYEPCRRRYHDDDDDDDDDDD